jgi:hypothetical protein
VVARRIRLFSCQISDSSSRQIEDLDGKRLRTFHVKNGKTDDEFIIDTIAIRRQNSGGDGHTVK